jgi:hypothetical protein
MGRTAAARVAALLALGVSGARANTPSTTHFDMVKCSGGDVPSYRATNHNCRARCDNADLHATSEEAFETKSLASAKVSLSCKVAGLCTVGTTATEVLQLDDGQNSGCAGGTFVPYFLVKSDGTTAAADGDGYVAGSHASNMVADTSGSSCYALEGPPEQPTYKLPMCKMYNEKSCCAPIHDAETQWAYETLVDVADRCLQYVNEEHFVLREFFCVTCDADQSRYTSVIGDLDSPFTDPKATQTNNNEVVGEIRICKSFGDRVWYHGGKDYDRCGFMIYTSGDDAKIEPFGDVHPATGDDPILPSKYWKYDKAKGTAIEQFFNAIKPGMLDKFQCVQLLRR